MRRLPFIPARDLRHRTAALALYRALLRSANRIPLPDGVPPPSSGISQLVRRRFVGNRAYTSLRLVYASMTAGYNFLTLFVKAQIPGSPEHAQVVDHIRARLISAASSGRSAQPPSRETPYRKPPSQPYAEALIRNTAPPGQPPVYASSALPRSPSALPGGHPRRVPSLCTTANGLPFLRIKKPQPRALSRMVGRKDRIFQRKIYKIVEIDEELVPGAVLEDEWERLVADQMRREDRSVREGSDGGPKTTFSWSVQLARLWWEWRVERTWQDWTARGTALNELVEQERSLAEEEKPGSAKTGDYDAAQGQRRPTRPRDGLRPNVAEHASPPLPLLSAITAKLGRNALVEGAKDPFISRSWAALVEAEQPRLMKWLSRGASAR